MQHYVATRPMFIDLEVMNADTRLVLGEHSSQATPSNVARGLASLYKEITGLEASLIFLNEIEFNYFFLLSICLFFRHCT